MKSNPIIYPAIIRNNNDYYLYFDETKGVLFKFSSVSNDIFYTNYKSEKLVKDIANLSGSTILDSDEYEITNELLFKILDENINSEDSKNLISCDYAFLQEYYIVYLKNISKSRGCDSNKYKVFNLLTNKFEFLVNQSRFIMILPDILRDDCAQILQLIDFEYNNGIPLCLNCEDDKDTFLAVENFKNHKVSFCENLDFFTVDNKNSLEIILNCK